MLVFFRARFHRPRLTDLIETLKYGANFTEPDQDMKARGNVSPTIYVAELYNISVRNTTTLDEQPILARYITMPNAPPAYILAFSGDEHSI